MNANKAHFQPLQIPWTKGQGAAERVARTPADYPIVSVVAWLPAGGSAAFGGYRNWIFTRKIACGRKDPAGEFNEKTIQRAVAAKKAATIRATFGAMRLSGADGGGADRGVLQELV